MPSKIAYIVSRFPHLPETFILREMIALEQLGWEIELHPLIIQRQELIHQEGVPGSHGLMQCHGFHSIY